MAHAHSTRQYLWIYGWLVALLVAGMFVYEMGLSKSTAVLLIFSIALVKAFLVVRNYMHLHRVPPVLYAIVGIPVLLAIAMVITLMPDIAFR